MEHDTELDPQVCYTDTHGYTEVVMATAALLGFDLAPRIRDVEDQTLYKMDRTKKYPHLDPLLMGIIRPECIRQSLDEVVRVIASIKARNVSPSLILHRQPCCTPQRRRGNHATAAATASCPRSEAVSSTRRRAR